MNIEHKSLSNGDLGPKTYEMGTLMWFDNDEKNRLYQETLAKMKDYLTSIDFRGDVDINCIVNEKGVYPLEITARFGFPALQLQQALSPEVAWGEFLKAVADGKQYDFKFKRESTELLSWHSHPFHMQTRSRPKSQSMSIYS